MRTVKTTTTVLFYAFRYALGRKAGAPHTISDAIQSNIDEFAEWELKQIIKEIEEFEDFYKSLGDDCDKETWYELIDIINQKLNEDEEDRTTTA